MENHVTIAEACARLEAAGATVIDREGEIYPGLAYRHEWLLDGSCGVISVWRGLVLEPELNAHIEKMSLPEGYS